MSGIGVTKDDNTAFHCFRHSAEMGNPKAQCNLGLCYLKGQGCGQDTELGFRWISAAVDSGFSIVLQTLQNMGLDVAKISGGYKQLRQVERVVSGEKFSGSYDRIFSVPNKVVLPMPPMGGVEGQE